MNHQPPAPIAVDPPALDPQIRLGLGTRVSDFDRIAVGVAVFRRGKVDQPRLFAVFEQVQVPPTALGVRARAESSVRFLT